MTSCENGKVNLWATAGVTTLTFHTVQMQEWTFSKVKAERIEPAKPEMKNTLFDLLEPRCELIEKVPVEVSSSNDFDGNHRPTETAI